MVLWAGSLGLGGCSSRKVSALPANSRKEQDERRVERSQVQEVVQEVQEVVQEVQVAETSGFFLFSGHFQDKEKRSDKQIADALPHFWSICA